MLLCFTLSSPSHPLSMSATLPLFISPSQFLSNTLSLSLISSSMASLRLLLRPWVLLLLSSSAKAIFTLVLRSRSLLHRLALPATVLLLV